MRRPMLHGSTTRKLVLHGSTTGRPSWPPSRWGTTCQGGGGTSGSGWVEDVASMDPLLHARAPSKERDGGARRTGWCLLGGLGGGRLRLIFEGEREDEEASSRRRRYFEMSGGEPHADTSERWEVE